MKLRLMGSLMMGPVPRRTFWWLLAAYLVLRVYLATLPGYVDDIDWYKRWALATATSGLSAAYETTNVDYPPFMLYPMYLVGKIYLMFDPDLTTEAVRNSTLFTALVKSPNVVFDLVSGGLLFWLVGRGGLWGRSLADPGWGRLVALLYLWNPAVLWGSGYWGQPDAILGALSLAALGALGFARTSVAGALLSAAVLTKPLAAPLVPLMAWGTAATRGFKGLLSLGIGGLAAALVVFLPFLLTGRLSSVLAKVLADIETMPFTSINAHNLWWILGPWRDANATVLVVLTPKLIGLLLFGAAYAALLMRLNGRVRQAAKDPGEYCSLIFLISAAVSSSFFFLSTHLHENHLFLAVPLLLGVAGRSRQLALLALGCSLAVFLNMILHDLELPYHMPSFLGGSSGVMDPYLGRPYTWMQLVGSYLNTLLVAVVAGGTYLAAWKVGK